VSKGSLVGVSISQTADPSEIGLDPARLCRLNRHFAEYVDEGRLAGWQVVVTRAGQIAHTATYGLADREAGRPVTDDTLWRIYSMTKPITSVAAMMLWEEGRFELTDEISRWLPEFADVKVYDKGSAVAPFLVPSLEPIRVWHLLTHTAGLTYGFLHTSPVDAIYRAKGWDILPPDGVDLATASQTFARLPLLFQPGSAWGYSVATDVLGRLVEVVSGQSLADFFAQRIFAPLGMNDSMWWADEYQAPRMAALYTPDPKRGPAVRLDAIGAHAFKRPALCSGGGGLISTAADYHRFTQMLLHEGQLDGVRLLGSRTVRFMTRNHLPGDRDLSELSTGGFAETTFEGVGFGLGFAVVRDPVPSRTPMSKGSYYWGGAASTFFWVDPAEELTVMLFTQLMPSSTYSLRPQMRQLVYSALV
jgi:CubicO group peptidase (beta-lactamase class C family)